MTTVRSSALCRAPHKAESQPKNKAHFQLAEDAEVMASGKAAAMGLSDRMASIFDGPASNRRHQGAARVLAG